MKQPIVGDESLIGCLPWGALSINQGDITGNQKIIKRLHFLQVLPRWVGGGLAWGEGGGGGLGAGVVEARRQAFTEAA